MRLEFPMDMIYQNQMLQSQSLLVNTNDSMHHHTSSTTTTNNNNSMGLDETNNAAQVNPQMQHHQMNSDGSENSASNEENVRP